MIYLVATISHVLVLRYSVAMNPSLTSFGVAALALAAGGASLVFRRSGFLLVSTLVTIVLYLANVLPGSGEIHVIESIAFGSTLFVHFEISRDLILIRSRSVEMSTYRKRLGSIIEILGLSAGTIVVIVTVGVSVYYHVPKLAQFGFSIPVFAALIFNLAAFVLAGTRSADKTKTELASPPEIEARGAQIDNGESQ